MRQSAAAPLALAAAALLGASPARPSPSGAAAPEPAHPAAPEKPHKEPPLLIQARPPPFSEGIFPCMQCHEDEKNPTRRQLDFHEEQQSIFDHDSEHRWCLDCHDLQNRNFLRLASGELVPFTESYRLCGQCHGDKYRDWRAGVHGKRVGYWNGQKTYLLCASCHNPHSPRFKGVKDIVVDGKPTVAPTLEKLKPMPPPKRPEEMRP